METRRSNEEYMLLTLSFGGAIAITPFAFIRFLGGDLLVTVIDLVLVLAMVAVGVYVYITKRIDSASVMLSVLTLGALTVIVHLRAQSAVFWAYPTMVGIYFLLTPRLAIRLTLLAAISMVPALYAEMATIPFVAVCLTLIVNSVFAYMFANRMKTQEHKLRQLVRRDPLTGAWNRRALDEKMDEIITLHKRIKQTASLIAIDVDHFKSINDNYGHAMGDQVLVKMVDIIGAVIRDTDSMYRIGGEEFVVLLIGSPQDPALNIAERIRALVESSDIIEDMTITISLGVAELNQVESGDEWMHRADKGMYEAKHRGRNRVCVDGHHD